MNEHDCSLEVLIDAENNGQLKAWGFEKAGYSVVEEGYNTVALQRIERALGPESLQSLNIVYALVTALEEGEKTTEQLTYELGFGSRLPLLRPYIQTALEAGLIEHVDFTNKSKELWKIAR